MSDSMAAMLEYIGKKRGCIVSGGNVDMLRTSNLVLDEFRAAKIGKITLFPLPRSPEPAAIRFRRWCGAGFQCTQIPWEEDAAVCSGGLLHPGEIQ